MTIKPFCEVGLRPASVVVEPASSVHRQFGEDRNLLPLLRLVTSHPTAKMTATAATIPMNSGAEEEQHVVVWEVELTVDSVWLRDELAAPTEEDDEDSVALEIVAAERTNAPLAGLSSAPPGKAAVIVVAWAVSDGVNSTEQDPSVSRHELAGAKSVPLLLCHVMVPLGEAPVTVAVQVMGEANPRVGGEQVTVTLGSARTMEIVKSPELGALPESPW